MEHPPPFWAAKALAEFVRERASWRRTKAQQFPDDARNRASADALEELATDVERLPDTDRSLIELVELDAFDDRDRFIASQEARRAVARWGYDSDSFMRPRDVIQNLVAITRRARRAQRPAQERTHEVTNAIEPTAPAASTLPTRNLDAIQRYVDDIFGKVVYHDREIERLESAIDDLVVDDKINRTGRALNGRQVGDLDDLLTDFRGEIKWVCAAVAPAAIRRATAIAEAAGGKYGQVIFDMDRDESTSYARELFDEAGIPERFLDELTDELTDDDQRSPARRDSFSATQQLIDLANKGDQHAIGQLKLHPALAFFDQATGRAISMERIPAKPREDLLLGILADITAGTIKGERFLAVDVSSMGNVRQITIAGAGAAQVSYDASLSDLEHLAKEGYLETAPKGRSLDVTVLEKAWKYRDWLRTMRLAEGGKDSQRR